MDAQHAGRAIVVGIDGSESALRAVQWAAAEAVRRNVALRVVTAFAWVPDHAYGRPGLGSEYRDVMMGVARRQLAEAAEVAAEALPSERIRAELTAGYPIPVLREESRQAQLVVLGDRGYGGVSGLLLGSVATALAAKADCPAVLVRTEDDVPVEDRTRPVVVGVDGSPVSEPALAFAFEAASMRGVPLVAVHTWWDLLVDPTLAPLLDWDAIEADERVILAERLAGWGEKFPDVPVERLVARDRPAHTLVSESRRAQLVVVGSRGRGAAAGLLLGSVSHALLHRSHCTVAVVRPAAEAVR